MSRMRWVFLFALGLMDYRAEAIEAVATCNLFHRTAHDGSDSAFVEISWQIIPSSLHYRKATDGSLVSEIETAITISNDSAIITRHRYTLQTLPMHPGDAAKQKITELRTYPIPQGKWRIRLALAEAAFTKAAFIFNDSLIVTPLTLPAISSLQLLDTFFASTVPGPFLKNGMQQLPLPLNFLDNGRRQLHFYAEIYPEKGQCVPISYYYISKKPMEHPLFDINLQDTLPKNPGMAPMVHSLDVGRLPSGNYYLNGMLKDTGGRTLANTSVFFQIINKKPDAAPLRPDDTGRTMDVKETGNYFDLSSTFVHKFNHDQLRAILKMILPQADPTEGAAILNFFKRPDELYTRYFVYNYFSKFNKAHPEQAWKEFSELIRSVNKDFNSGGTMGFETDRGVIYLKYGKPDERVRVPNEQGAVPYEIWRYNTVGRTSQVGLFLFYQSGAGNDFRLVHSTAPGERYNPDWKKLLYTNGQPSGNGNSRAEQYFDGK